MEFGLIGASKTGITIAHHLWKNGHQPVFLWNRSIEKYRDVKNYVPFISFCNSLEECNASVDFIIFSVSDDALPEIATEFLQLHKNRSAMIFHTSGVLDSSIFGNYQRSGSMHPVISISSIERGIELIPNTTFTCEGAIAEDLQKFACEIGKTGVILSREQKKSIHLSAVFMNNYLKGMIEEVKLLNENFGIANAGEILQAITEQTVEQSWQFPIEKTLTGPVKRGDINTVKKHLEMLKENKLFQQLYKNFGNILLKFVNNDNEKYTELKNLFEKCEK